MKYLIFLSLLFLSFSKYKQAQNNPQETLTLEQKTSPPVTVLTTQEKIDKISAALDQSKYVEKRQLKCATPAKAVKVVSVPPAVSNVSEKKPLNSKHSKKP